MITFTIYGECKQILEVEELKHLPREGEQVHIEGISYIVINVSFHIKYNQIGILLEELK